MGKAGEEQGRGTKESRVPFGTSRARLSAASARVGTGGDHGGKWLTEKLAVWSAESISFKCSKRMLMVSLFSR